MLKNSDPANILKLDNFIHRLGSVENYYEIQRMCLEGKKFKDIAKNFGMSPGQFSDYLNNAFIFVPVERPGAVEHITRICERQQRAMERPHEDERIRQAVNVIRLQQSGDRRIPDVPGSGKVR